MGMYFNKTPSVVYIPHQVMVAAESMSDNTRLSSRLALAAVKDGGLHMEAPPIVPSAALWTVVLGKGRHRVCVVVGKVVNLAHADSGVLHARCRLHSVWVYQYGHLRMAWPLSLVPPFPEACPVCCSFHC